MSAFHDNALMGASGQQGYQISRSVRLRNSATGYFSRTIGGTATNAKIGTLSMWVKRGGLTSATGNSQYLIQTGISATTDSGHFTMFFTTSDTLSLGQYSWAGYSTTQVFRDPSAWYHIVLSYNSTLASNNLTIYVNGVQIAVTSVVQNTNWAILSGTEAINIGRHTSVGRSFDGYLTEINLIDGQALTPSSFGETDAVTGVWKPKKYAGTYGNNGFYLNFSDNSSNTATTIGKDYSGNGNNWTPNNISVTSGVTYDSMLDVPTPYADGGNGRGNYAVLNPLDAQGTATLSDANLTLASATTAHKNRKATFLLPSTGKWYWELTTASTCSSSVILGWGLQTTSAASDSQAGNANTWMAQNDANQDIFNQTTSVLSTGSAVSGGSIRQVAYDADTGKLWFGINNTWYSSTDLTSGNPSAGTNQCMTLSAGDYFPAITCYNLTANANFGQRPFSYTPPSGFKALNTFNLPDSTIKAGNKHFDTLLWTSNASVKSVTGSAFQPDLVWVKDRVSASANEGYHHLVDSVRGAGKVLSSNSTTTEYWSGTNNSVTAFNSNGFSSGIFDGLNGDSMVSWLWKAGNGSSSNTDGSITSTVSVNATAGFSIASFTNVPAVASAYTVGHGLGVAPKLVIVKKRTANADSWFTYHASVGNTAYLALESTAGATTSLIWSNTSPTSTTFTIRGGSFSLGLSDTFIAYCFSEVAGFSRIGSYTSNQNADGPFIYLGFRPRFLMIKRTDTAQEWVIVDTGRSTYNQTAASLLPNSAGAEGTGNNVDVTANGFKIRTAGDGINFGVGGTYIYAAFAENPFKNALAR